MEISFQITIKHQVEQIYMEFRDLIRNWLSTNISILIKKFNFKTINFLVKNKTDLNQQLSKIKKKYSYINAHNSCPAIFSKLNTFSQILKVEMITMSNKRFNYNFKTMDMEEVPVKKEFLTQKTKLAIHEHNKTFFIS
jgi:hypothetical protein